LTITFECYDYSSGSAVRYELWRTANGFYVLYSPKNNPAVGDDFFGFAWGGDFYYDDEYAFAWWDNGEDAPIYEAEAKTNAGVVWSFEEYMHLPGYDMYVDEVMITADLHKNYKIGGGNTTQAILKYIHTYQDAVGSITITADPSGVGSGFTLGGTPNQWSIVCPMSGLYY
jgi:hypothetical protein